MEYLLNLVENDEIIERLIMNCIPRIGETIYLKTKPFVVMRVSYF